MSLSFTGWTPSVFRQAASTLSGAPTASGGSVQPNAPVNTASDLLAGNTSGSPTGDSALHSRKFVNPLTGNRDVATAASVYSNPSVPAYLSDAVNSLNMEQIQKQNALTSFQNELLKRFDTGFGNGPNQYLNTLNTNGTGGSGGGGGNEDESYLISEALRAMAVQPGAHVSFGQAVQNPAIGAGYLSQSNALAQLNQSKAQTVSQGNSNNYQLQTLMQQRQDLGQNAFGMYEGSQQQALDQKISALQNPLPNAVTSAATSSGGWVPMP